MSLRLSRLCLGAFLCAATASSVRAQEATISPSQTPATPIAPFQAPPGLPPTPSQPTLQPNLAARDAGAFSEAPSGTKFYTITASLREEYDDNIYTSRDNPTASAVTEFSPSILVTFPIENSTFTARYTFGLDYYENKRNDPVDYTHEVLVHYTHRFSNRFSLDLSDQGGYFTDPDILNSIGTPFRDGSFFSNTFAASFQAQWTPTFGTSTSYSNSAIIYQDEDVGRIQNEDENSFSHDFSFAIYPKYNLTAGVIVDDTQYFDVERSYLNSTLNGGVDWQALPNLTAGARVGLSFTQGDRVEDSINPYAAANLNWQIGRRSSLALSYVHTVEPTDVNNAVGQQDDRFTVRFSYDLTASLSSSLAVTYTHAEYDGTVLQGGPTFSEDDLALVASLSYRLTTNFSVEGGYSLSDISSQQSFRDYTRNQVYLGVRGTY